MLWWSDYGKLFRLPPWVQHTLKSFTGGFRQRFQLGHKTIRNLWKQPSYISDIGYKMHFSVLILYIIQLTKRLPKADWCYLKTFATVMWHLWRFSLFNVNVKVQEILVDRCLQTDVGRTGLVYHLYEWVQFRGSLKAVVVTARRLYASCHMATNCKVSCFPYALCMFRFSLPPCSNVSEHPSAWK